MDEARGRVEIAAGASGPTHHFAPPRLPTYLPGKGACGSCAIGELPLPPRACLGLCHQGTGHCWAALLCPAY